jgi:hypothetical protein
MKKNDLKHKINTQSTQIKPRKVLETLELYE